MKTQPTHPTPADAPYMSRMELIGRVSDLLHRGKLETALAYAEAFRQRYLGQTMTIRMILEHRESEAA